MRIAALIVVALVIAAGSTWYVASPSWTLHQMKAAADANDPDALDAYVDYLALREDLKSEIKKEMTAAAAKDKSGFGGVGLAVGKALIGQVVDGLVTPTAMRAALIAKRDQQLTRAAPETISALRMPDDPIIVRRGFSEFLVASKQQPKSGLLFRRHGLGWKLSGVELPPTG